MQTAKIPDGQKTKTIYTLIKEAKYQDVSESLSRPLVISPMNFSSAPEVDRCHCWPTATT